MQNITEALATKTANEAARRFVELIESGHDVQRALHLVIREATEYHPTCGMLVAKGLESLVAA